MPDQNKTVQLSPEDFGKKWGVILNQALGENVLLQKEAVLLQEHIDLLAAQNEQLAADLGNMREQLSVVKKELLKKEGKEIIDSVGVE